MVERGNVEAAVSGEVRHGQRPAGALTRHSAGALSGQLRDAIKRTMRRYWYIYHDVKSVNWIQSWLKRMREDQLKPTTVENE